MSKKGFTLAEVLVTLGVIGVVSAITLPTLIKNYNKYVTAQRLKKAYSEIQNAVRLSTIENGEPNQWDITFKFTGVKNFVKTYYLPFFKSSKEITNYQFYNLNGYKNIYPYLSIQISNCTVLSFYGETLYSAWLFVDINGKSNPNRIGRDIFVLNYYNNKKFIPVFYGSDRDISSIINSGNTISDEQRDTNRDGMGCSDKNKNGFYAGFYCGALIQLNNWEIPKDYPW